MGDLGSQEWRDASNIFLDLLQVMEYGDEAFSLATQRFAEAGIVTVDVDVANEQVELDLSHIIMGALALIQAMLPTLAKNWGMSEDEAVVQLRGMLAADL